jgi:hypothetical protein
MGDFLDIADVVREGQSQGTQLREQFDLGVGDLCYF